MAFRTTPSLGPELYTVVKKDQVWYNGGNVATPELGNTEIGSDGRFYIWVEASGAITVGSGTTETQLEAPTVSDYVIGAGSGGFYLAVTGDTYDGTIAAGDRFYAAKGTAPVA